MIFRDDASLGGGAPWRSSDLVELLPEVSGQRACVEYLAGEGIATPIEELAALALVTAAISPRVVFEIGTFRGRTALNFALNSPPHCEVFTLDLPPDKHAAVAPRANAADKAIIDQSAPGADYVGKPEAAKIRQLYGDAMTFDFSPYRGRVDLFFVDGAHDYESARHDTDAALSCVRDGGWVLWHDFGNYGEYNDVTRAVLELVPEAVEIGNTQLAAYRKTA
jgi:predicted O-methyltransferase YrrM